MNTSFVFNEGSNGGEELLLTTQIHSYNDDPSTIYISQTFSLNSYANSVSMHLINALTPSMLRKCADEIEAVINKTKIAMYEKQSPHLGKLIGPCQICNEPVFANQNFDSNDDTDQVHRACQAIQDFFPCTNHNCSGQLELMDGDMIEDEGPDNNPNILMLPHYKCCECGLIEQ